MLRTTSQIISHYMAMEEASAENYGRLADAYPRLAAEFRGLAEESLRHRERVTRAYQMGVTDAFEVGFTSPVDPEAYRLSEVATGDLGHALKASILNEEKTIEFCVEAARSSGELLPGLPDAFEWLIKRKRKRVERLRALT